MIFNIDNKLIFTDSFQFLNSSLDSLVKNLSKADFSYLSQKFDDKVLDLVKQKGFYPYENMSDFRKFQGELPSKENLYSSLTGKNISDEEYEHVFMVWNTSQMKTMKEYHNLYLQCDALLLAEV